MVAAATAPWWYILLAGLALLGYVSLVVGVFLELIVKFIHWITKPLRPSYSVNVFMEGEHRDPTRPRSWEDEMEARYVVAERMKVLEKMK